MRTSHVLGEGDCHSSGLSQGVALGLGQRKKGEPTTHGLGCLYCSSQAPTPIFPERGLGEALH